MASGRKFQPTQDLALSCLSSLMVQHLSSGARLQNCYVSRHRALSVLDIRWWLSRECPPPTPPLVGAGLGGSSNTGGGRASKKNGAGVSKRSFQPVTGVGVWGTSCLLAPAPGSWSCFCPPRLTRSLHSLLSSIILMHAHPVSSGSKRWNPAHPRSVQRVCPVETCTPGRTRAEAFPWPSCSREPAHCSLWGHVVSPLCLSVSLFPVSLILLGFSTQQGTWPCAAAGPTQPESKGFPWPTPHGKFQKRVLWAWVTTPWKGHCPGQQHTVTGKAVCFPCNQWLTSSKTRLEQEVPDNRSATSWLPFPDHLSAPKFNPAALAPPHCLQN